MRSSSAALRFAALLLATVAIATTAHAQNTALSGFMPTKDYTVTVNGKPVDADVYQQGDRPAVIVVTKALPHAVMLDVRTGNVLKVDASRIERQRDGSYDLVGGALGGNLGSFTMAREGTTFTIQGRKVVVAHAASATKGAPAK
jgi:hypothetical protein